MYFLCCLCYWLLLLLPLQYLDHLFERDPKCGGVYHERQVELYAKFDSEKLLPFLRSCNDIPLQNVNAIHVQHVQHVGIYYYTAIIFEPNHFLSSKTLGLRHIAVHVLAADTTLVMA